MRLYKNNKEINIGVLCFRDTGTADVPVYGVNKAYLEYVSRLGNIILIDAHDTHVHTELDALVLPGGEDVLTLENRIPSYYQGRSNPHATFFYEIMFPKYAHLPILGICMGMQAVLLYSSNSEIVQHVDLPSSYPRSKKIDTLEDSDGKVLLQMDGKTQHKVNSIHHQCFYPDDIDKDRFTILAKSREHGNVEVVMNKAGNQYLVQFHPKSLGL